jgi:outer membrane protein OmpA-like peptidoglycan-associated protein
MQTRLILLLALTATPAWAGPVTLGFAVPATQTGERVEAPVRHGFAIAAFDGAEVPKRVVEGALDMRAYRLDGVRDNTLALLLPLQAQLAAAGFTPLFDCQTTACGGFDFRFGLEVLAEPQMHVDLGDFRYLVAENPGGDMVSLLISKAADQGFVQVTSVTKGVTAVQTPAPQADVTSAAPAPALPTAPIPEAAAPGSLAEQVLATGSAALDDLVFASGKATLEEGEYPSLAALAVWLQTDPALRVTLVGHTDATGSLAGNVALSRQRAVAVRERLMAKLGVAGGQMDAQGAGYLAPRASNQTPEGRQKNRRVEVMLTSTP